MTTINLRDYYPFFKSDFFVEVTDEVAKRLKQFNRKDHADYDADVSTKHTIPLMLMTVLKRMLSCWFYRRRKSMSAN